MKVYITRRIPQPAIDYLSERGFDVDVQEQESAPGQSVILNKIKDADAIISLLSDSINKEVIDSADKLKVIANYAVGYNNIDVAYARSKKIIVTNTPDVLTDATADLTWALILAVSKRVVEGDQYVRAGKFKGWGPLMMLGGDVSGKSLGIVGPGRIGQAVGRRAAGFDMRICYVGRRRVTEFEDRTGAQMVSLDNLLAESDFISFHCPLLPETRHLINKDSINLVKKDAYIINTSRGPVIDEQVLVQALKKGTLAGAGLDVYEYEPEVTRELLDLKNVILLPHIGSATMETRTKMGLIAARNVSAVLNGKSPVTPV